MAAPVFPMEPAFSIVHYSFCCAALLTQWCCEQETLAKEAAGMSGGVARLNNMLMQMRSVTPWLLLSDRSTRSRTFDNRILAHPVQSQFGPPTIDRASCRDCLRANCGCEAAQEEREPSGPHNGAVRAEHHIPAARRAHQGERQDAAAGAHAEEAARRGAQGSLFVADLQLRMNAALDPHALLVYI